MADVSVFQDRIKLLIDARFGGNKSEFSRATGIPESTVRSYLLGNYPKMDKIAEICETLAVSADWLILGRGLITGKESMNVDASTFVVREEMVNNENRLLNIIDSQQRQLEAQTRIIEELTKKVGNDVPRRVARAGE